MNLIRKSIGASILIAIGDAILLKMGNPLGPFLFAFGLLGVCTLDLNLFTGKAGYLVENNLYLELPVILAFNTLGGVISGKAIRATGDMDIINNAILKVSSWEISPGFVMKSIFCGAIMYISVDMYKKNNILGILFRVPLFIFCGFQHCIANIITMGIAWKYSNTIWLCILGNLIGSLVAWAFTAEK